MADHQPITDVRSSEESVDHPIRGADRNRHLVDKADPDSQKMLFPTLEAGLTLLDVTGGRGVPALQSLVLDHLLLNEGSVFWIDADGHAATTTLAQIAPSQRVLNRIHVARGFTAYQHHAAVADLPAAITQSDPAGIVRHSNQQEQSTDDTDSKSVSLIVAPALDARYRDDETLAEGDTTTLQLRTLARLVSYAEDYGVPVLVTRTTVDEFTEPIATAADQHLQCEQTSMGPRFTGEDFETLVYPTDSGAYYQTTLAYWRQLLRARAREVGIEPLNTISQGDTTRSIGTAGTAEGAPTTSVVGPLADAWSLSGGQ